MANENVNLVVAWEDCNMHGGLARHVSWLYALHYGNLRKFRKFKINLFHIVKESLRMKTTGCLHYNDFLSELLSSSYDVLYIFSI